LMEMDALWKSKRDLDAYSDYGVLLAYLGRYDEAKAVYEEIEKITPGRYSTAANLGTVYELLGQNDLALKWIKKAVEIDPTSHEGSEWIHVKILEAKIKGDKALTSEFLLGINFGNDTIPESQMDSTELVKLREALFFNFKNEFHS
jgi:tetratricopeptide (TPR) repeat protein